MAELAKTHISIVDDSAFSAGIDTLIPLFVFATEQDKVLDESTGEIAVGTTKSLANELTVVTSRRDVIDKFGVPSFTELNGTVQQGDELNEVGLFGLFDAMGTTSVAYALRADIDLKQLKASEEEPTSNVKAGTYWLDMNNTDLGLFICNGSTISAKAWDKVREIALFDSEDSLDGEFGSYAVVVNDGIQKVYEKVSSGWVVIGSEGWKSAHSDLNVYTQSAINYPKNANQGDLWVKTTPVNGGVSYSLKRYSSTSDLWKSVDLPTCTSLVDGEALFGTSLEDGSLLACVNGGETSFKKYTDKGLTLSITGTEKNPTLVEGSIFVKVVKDGVLKTVEVKSSLNEELASFVEEATTSLKADGLQNIHFEKTSENEIKIVAEKTSVLNISGSNDLLNALGISSGDHEPESKYWEVVKSFKVSMNEPREVAEDGTLWFNDDLIVDIMVNDGTSWKGYNSQYPSANIYVTSEDPMNNVESVADDSLWIDTNDSNYPSIKRYIGGDWNNVDNTDQTTPLGVVFADARYYGVNDAKPTFTLGTNGLVKSNMLTDDTVDPDCPNPQTYPAGILLFNTRISTNNVKEYKSNPFEGLVDSEGKYKVGGYEGTLTKKARWVSASGNAVDGSGLFGKRAQRSMVVKALAEAIQTNEDIRSMDYDFFFASVPGYPELDDELISLNVDKKEMFEIITDTPKTLKPQGKAIQEWGTNANNTSSHGLDGRVLKNEYVVRHYPPMGLASNIDGEEIAIPTSIVKMNNLLVLPRGQICAGTQNGQVSNVASVGYITDENEYSSVVLSDGIGEVCTAQNINPIMPRRNTGLLIWGESTENPVDSSLSDEHAIITLLRLKRRLEAVCQPFFFRINNESLRTEFERALRSILNEFVGSGEIYDYAIDVDTTNTVETINRRELWANIAIEIAKGVEQIYLPIRVASTGSL